MGFLSRIFGYASRHDREGATFDDAHAWTLEGRADPDAFLRALPILFPSGRFVYFEGTTYRQFATWLKANSVPAPLKVGMETIWPRPDFFHLPLQPDLLASAADIVDDKGIALPSIHLQVHDGSGILLYWHDAFGDDPMFVAKSVPSDRIEEFAGALGISATRGRPTGFEGE